MLSSPAETSGIKVLDVVTHVNKTPVSSSHDLLSIVGLKIGAPISLRVQRSVSVPSTDPNLPARYTVEEHTLKGLLNSLCLRATDSFDISCPGRAKYLYATKNPTKTRDGGLVSAATTGNNKRNGHLTMLIANLSPSYFV